MNKYRFCEGQKVRIRSGKTASIGVNEHAGEIVTIKSRCTFTYAYELVELDGLWQDDCFEEVTLRYAICDFNHRTGTICDTNGSLVWQVGTLEKAMQQVENGTSCCALFLPKDLPNYGHPLDFNVTRKDFEAAPAIYGVCYFKGWSGYVFE